MVQKEKKQSLEKNKTETKQKKQYILRQTAVLNGINEVFQKALTCKNEADVARTCLSVAEKLTGSKFGFIGEINDRGRFDTIALSDPSWSDCRVVETDAVILIRDMEIRGIWGQVIKDEQPMIVNDPASHPNRVGVPEGHPPLTHFLGVPLRQGQVGGQGGGEAPGSVRRRGRQVRRPGP